MSWWPDGRSLILPSRYSPGSYPNLYKVDIQTGAASLYFQHDTKEDNGSPPGSPSVFISFSCSANGAVSRRAASPTTSKRSDCSRMTCSVCRPIEPVLPSKMRRLRFTRDSILTPAGGRSPELAVGENAVRVCYATRRNATLHCMEMKLLGVEEVPITVTAATYSGNTQPSEMPLIFWSAE